MQRCEKPSPYLDRRRAAVASDLGGNGAYKHAHRFGRDKREFQQASRNANCA
jgi:hypothetical protein